MTQNDDVYAYLKATLGISGTLNDLLFAYYKQHTGLSNVSFNDAKRAYFQQRYGKQGTINDVAYGIEGGTNLVTNPRGRNTSGTVTVRESLYNPAHMNNLAFTDGSGGNPVSILEQPSYRGYSLPVAPGDVYTITRKNITNRFRWVFTVDPPASGVSNFGGTGQATAYDAEPTATITVPDGAAYLLLYLSNAGEDVGGLLIERGSTALQYFDATTWDGDPDLSPQWSGTPGSSAARLVGPVPVGFIGADNAFCYYSVKHDAYAITRKPGSTGIVSLILPGVTSAGTHTVVSEVWSTRTSFRARAYIPQFDNGTYITITGRGTLRLSGTATSGAHVAMVVDPNTVAHGDVFYVRAARFTGDYTGPFFDGDSPNAKWNGIPHASTSTLFNPGRALI